MDTRLLEAKEVALKLRAKAELLESLSEDQLDQLNAGDKNKFAPASGAQDSNAGCWIITACVVVECFSVSET